MKNAGEDGKPRINNTQMKESFQKKEEVLLTIIHKVLSELFVIPNEPKRKKVTKRGKQRNIKTCLNS